MTELLRCQSDLLRSKTDPLKSQTDLLGSQTELLRSRTDLKLFRLTFWGLGLKSHRSTRHIPEETWNWVLVYDSNLMEWFLNTEQTTPWYLLCNIPASGEMWSREQLRAVRVSSSTGSDVQHSSGFLISVTMSNNILSKMINVLPFGMVHNNRQAVCWTVWVSYLQH